MVAFGLFEVYIGDGYGDGIKTLRFRGGDDT